MDSITKLQGKLREAEEILKYVSKELEGYGENKTVGENLNFPALKLRGEQYSFYEHPLKGKLFRDGYLALLIYVISLGGKKEEGWTLLYRIGAACDYQGELQSLTTDAMTLTEERISELIRGICEEKLERTFAVDTMMISHHMGADDAQLNFLAGLYELMTIDKNFLAEAIQFVKIFDSTFWDNLAEKSRTWKFLTARDIATYIGAYPAESLDEAAKLEHKRVVIKDITYTSKDVLNLDDWKADEILFLNCSFENCGGICSENKVLNFAECKFTENIVRYKDVDNNHHWGWTHNKYSSYRGFLQVNSTIFAKCTFKHFRDDVPMIFLENGKIEKCIFEECYQGLGSMLLNINKSIVIDTKFISCGSRLFNYMGSVLYGSNNKSGMGCLIYSYKGSFIKNEFINCNSIVKVNTSSYPLSCIILMQESSCKDCKFESSSINCTYEAYQGGTYREYRGRVATIGMMDSEENENKGDVSIIEISNIPKEIFIVGDKHYDN